jgi:hypothetical protein
MIIYIVLLLACCCLVSSILASTVVGVSGGVPGITADNSMETPKATEAPKAQITTSNVPRQSTNPVKFKSGSNNWKYLNARDIDDAECFKNWDYVDDKNNIIEANIKSYTTRDSKYPWCPVSKDTSTDDRTYRFPL